MPAKGRAEARFWPVFPTLEMRGKITRQSGNQLGKESAPANSGEPIAVKPVHRGPHLTNPALDIARIGAFSALVAVGTILSNALLGFSLPPPLGEITAAPAFYMAIAVLFSRKVSFWSTAMGSAVGETINIFFFGEAPSAFALTFVPGIILARAPEALIIYRFRQKTIDFLAFIMGLATVFETLVFFFIDWPVYSLTAFYCTQSPCGASGLAGGFWLAAFDFGTLIDLVWIPVALGIIAAVRRAFNLRFFD